MAYPMQRWQKWLLVISLGAAFSLGLPALAAGRIWWFAGNWADPVFVALLFGWLSLALVLRSPDETGYQPRRPDLPHLLFYLGFLALITVAVYDRTHGPAAAGSAVWSLLGMALCLVAAPVGIIGVYALGHFYAPDPTVMPGQEPIADHVYHYVRHPIYTALLLWAIGLPLVVRSWWGVAVAVLFLAPGLLLRISTEEALLLKTYGDDYRAYQERTWKLIPFVF